MSILITGASGCVGQYLVAEFLARGDALVIALVRDARKLAPALRANPRLQVVEVDLRDIDRIAPLLPGVTAAILVATAWGGPDTLAITRDANVALTDRLIEAGCGQVLYFATASVLDHNGALLAAARDRGTEYIRAKYALVEAMEARAGAIRVTGLFPTLVVGGDAARGTPPLSHFARLLLQLGKWMWLLRFLSADARLHIIHAADIATVIRHIVGAQSAPARLVLANPVSSADDLVAATCRHMGLRRRRLLTLRPMLAEPLIRLFRIRLSPWDRYCMLHPDQSYAQPVNPAQFGLPVVMPDISTALTMLGDALRA